MTFTPIPIFFYHNYEPEKCPACGKPEEKKVSCAHCGHEYKDEEEEVSFAAVLGAVGVATWALLTLSWWGVDNSVGHGSTLLEVVQGQWQFVWRLSQNIW
jgi:hypothetical protein